MADNQNKNIFNSIISDDSNVTFKGKINIKSNVTEKIAANRQNANGNTIANAIKNKGGKVEFHDAINITENVIKTEVANEDVIF